MTYIPCSSQSEITVNTSAGNPLEVNDASAQAYLEEIEANVSAILGNMGDTSTLEALVSVNNTLMQNDTLLRAPLTTLEGATFASCGNTTVTLASAGNNTSGVIIRRFDGVIRSTIAYCVLVIDGKTVGSLNDSNTTHIYSIENIFVPSGSLVQLTGVGAAYPGRCWYEIL